MNFETSNNFVICKQGFPWIQITVDGIFVRDETSLKMVRVANTPKALLNEKGKLVI